MRSWQRWAQRANETRRSRQGRVQTCWPSIVGNAALCRSRSARRDRSVDRDRLRVCRHSPTQAAAARPPWSFCARGPQPRPGREGPLSRIQRPPALRVRRAAALVRPEAQPADSTRALASRTRRRAAGQREALGEPPGVRAVCRRQSRGPGTPAGALLLGCARRHRRSRAHAAARRARPAVASDRPPSHLRGRRKHGRAIRIAARRRVPTPSRRRRCARCTDEPRCPLSSVPTTP